MIRQRRRRNRLNPVRRNPQIYSRTDTIKAEKPSNYFNYLVIILIFGLIYIFFFSKAFKISEFKITGDEVKKEEIQKRILEITDTSFLMKNIVLLNKEKLEGLLKEDKTIKSVKIEKVFSSKTLNIKVETEKPVAIWSEKGKKYLLNERGIIYKEVGEEGEEKGINLLNINYKLSELHTLGDKALIENTFIFTNSLIKNFELKVTDKISYLEFDNSQNELTVYTPAYKVFFDTKRDAISQLDKLNLVKKEALAKNRNLDYVDLRIESRVFYKLRW